MKRYFSTYVVCPYYCSEEPQKIYCEGCKEKTTIHLAFESSKDKKDYKKAFCCSMKNYDNCRIADMLNLKHIMESEKREKQDEGA